MCLPGYCRLSRALPASQNNDLWPSQTPPGRGGLFAQVVPASHHGIRMLYPMAWSVLIFPPSAHPRMPGHGVPVNPPLRACLWTCGRDVGCPGPWESTGTWEPVPGVRDPAGWHQRVPPSPAVLGAAMPSLERGRCQEVSPTSYSHQPTRHCAATRQTRLHPLGKVLGRAM